MVESLIISKLKVMSSNKEEYLGEGLIVENCIMVRNEGVESDWCIEWNISFLKSRYGDPKIEWCRKKKGKESQWMRLVDCFLNRMILCYYIVIFSLFVIWQLECW